ncbi:sigma-70 family RNA polymerase sigma factor [Planctomicrobium sp. SH664]|uniref:sigma-70 family RNA polymerase sigma factor n=1 Tax=Planctomicrobium sp. SH664 TaxID=3448125 RepID=UPI003F5BB4F5
MRHLDPAELRERLRRHPEEVLAEEFGKYRARLWRIIQFRLDAGVAGRIEIDDVLQETWLSSLQRIGYFLEHESLSMFVWLRMMVGQTIIDLHRRHLGAKMRDAYREVSYHQSDLSRSTSASIVSKLLGQVSTPSRVMLREETAQQLRAAIDSMDPIDREVLALRHYEELSNQEVAEVLGIQVKAASIRYVRAVQRLKKILEDFPGFEGNQHVTG